MLRNIACKALPPFAANNLLPSVHNIHIRGFARVLTSKKGEKDAKRANAHAKVSREVSQASKACGGGISNLRLSTAIAKARQLELPKNKIMAAIERGTNSGKVDVDMEVVRYDGVLKVGQSVVQCVVMTLTENRNRTGAVVRATFKKCNGELQKTGSLDYLFEEVGLITMKNSENDEDFEDNVMEAALESGAEDVTYEDNICTIKTSVAVLSSVSSSLKPLISSEEDFAAVTKWIANQTVEVDEEGADALSNFVDRLDENEDVTDVYHSAENHNI
ncbi:hypothetical protein TrLO_g8497 [Triparma laevis f. longispina]|nr:hypothetical protein TrLO_g8497 [Triparma laevis f. longispina]